MAKRERIFNVFALCGLIAIMLCGCYNRDGKVFKFNHGNDYAIIYDRALTYAKESFIETHLTSGPSYNDMQALDENYPKTYCILVDNENDFCEIFDEFPDDIDFDKESLIVYCFSCIYNGNGYKICKINSVGESMSIEISHIPPSKPHGKYVSAPTYRIIAIKTSVVNLKSASVKEL